MFSNLHRQTKILIVAMFLLLCSMCGLLMSITINTIFPKNVAIAENKAPIKGKEPIADKVEKEQQKEEDKKSEIQQDVKKEADKEANKEKILDYGKDIKESIDYVVGKDIEKGIYKIFSTGDIGSYKITDKKNTHTSEIMYFNFAYVSLKDGQTLTLTNSTMVSEANLTPYSDKEYVDGQYKVGYDIKVGSYDIKPISGVGKIEIYSNLNKTKPDVTKYVEAPTTIKLKNNQYITITNVEMSRWKN